jgi:threonine aldolase
MKFADAMKERGVIANSRGPSSFRAVTHHGISRRDIDRVVAAAAEAAGEVFGD